MIWLAYNSHHKATRVMDDDGYIEKHGVETGTRSTHEFSKPSQNSHVLMSCRRVLDMTHPLAWKKGKKMSLNMRWRCTPGVFHDLLRILEYGFV
jgi:hypothetical protein